MNPAPTNKFYVLGRPGWPRPCVMTNLCRGRCSHRPANLAAAGTFAGGYGIRPYERGRALRSPGMAATNRTTVGRGALTPPGPAAVQTPAGGINPAPTNKFYVLGRPGWPRPCVMTNLCRGRCSHRPANLAAAGTFAGGYGIRPYERGRALRSPGMAATNRTTVGRGAITPPHPAVAQTPGGGMNPAPTINGRPAASRETATLSRRKPM